MYKEHVEHVEPVEPIEHIEPVNNVEAGYENDGDLDMCEDVIRQKKCTAGNLSDFAKKLCCSENARHGRTTSEKIYKGERKNIYLKLLLNI